MQDRQNVCQQLAQVASGTKLKDLSQSTGISQGNLSRTLNGKSNFTLDFLLKITNALGVEIKIK